jgi:hypothetical protein
MQTTAPRFEDHKGLVHMQALSGMRWAQGAGAAGVLDYNDMFQVASLAFCIAAQGYDPDSGFKFSAYYTQVAFSEIRKEIGLITGVKNLNEDQRAEIVARKEENKQRRAQALPELPDMKYGIAPMYFSEMAAPGEDDSAMPYEASIPADVMTPEQQVENADLWKKESVALSPLAQVIVSMLLDPPDELLREIAARRAYADQCTAFGKRAHGLRDGVTIAAICKFLALVGDIKKRELILAEAELAKVVERIEKAQQS